VLSIFIGKRFCASAPYCSGVEQASLQGIHRAQLGASWIKEGRASVQKCASRKHFVFRGFFTFCNLNYGLCTNIDKPFTSASTPNSRVQTLSVADIECKPTDNIRAHRF